MKKEHYIGIMSGTSLDAVDIVICEIDTHTCKLLSSLEYPIPQELKADGLLATCIQHEIDHLEGILFIDYLSKLKKEMIIKKLSKQTKESVERIVV